MIFLFFSCGKKKEILKIKGSDTELNLLVTLAEVYSNENPNAVISVSGGGSGLGIASLFNQNTDIATSSRELKEEEYKRFKNNGRKIGSFIFAYDALVFIVSNDLAVDSLDLEALKKILEGKIKNWSSVNPKIHKPITIYGRQSNSGTLEYLKKTLNILISPFAKQLNGNAQIMEAVQADNTGIGYVSLGFILSNPNHKVKPLWIKKDENSKAISPLDNNRDYFFVRPLYHFYDKKDSIKVGFFFEFEKSEKAKKIIQEFGYKVF
jgi:phosphate transport system substrate-binding protein